MKLTTKANLDLENLTFTDIFDLKEIQEMQDLFSDATGVASIITHPDGSPITQPSNFCRLCSDIIRKTEKGCANCFKSDASLGRYHPSGPLVQPCMSGGLWDAGASISVGGQHIANWLIGQVRNEAIEDGHILEYADVIGVDKELFKAALNEVPVMSVEQFHRVAKMLFSFSNQLSDKGYKNLQLNQQIKEKEQTIALLHQSQEHFKKIVETSVAGIISFDRHATTQFVNHKFLEMTGYTTEELIGKSIKLFMKDEDVDEYQESLQDRIKNDEQIYEKCLRKKNGDPMWTIVSTNAFVNCEGEFDGFFSLFVDITERKEMETSLFESSAKLSSIIENSLYDIWAINTDYEIIYINTHFQDAFQNSFGVKLLEGMNILNNLPESLREVWKLHYDRALRNESFEFEDFVDLGENSIYFEVTMNPILHNERVIGASFFSRDITPRKKIEKELQVNRDKLEQNERRLSFALNATSDAIWEWDFTTGKTVYSKRWFEMLGYEDHELEMSFDAWGEICHPDDYQPTVDKINAVLDEAQANGFNAEFRMRHKDGSWKWILGRGNVVVRDDHGKPLLLSGTNTDISARKQAEFELRESEDKLFTLFNSMKEMVVLHELVFNEEMEAINYRIIDCNHAYTHVTGIPKEAAIGKLGHEVYGTDTPPYLTEFSQVAISGVPYEYTTYFAPMDKHFSISVVSPKKNTFATITIDITSIIQTQEIVASKNKELENYLYVASHDLRSPLVNIQGFCKRLLRHTDQFKEYLQAGESEKELMKEELIRMTQESLPKTLHYIFSNVEKMDTLINGLLQISRTGRIEMSIQKIDMKNLIEKVVASFNFQLAECAASVTLNTLDDCYGDEKQINQLFSNIIGNALKYRDKERKLMIVISSSIQFNKVIYKIQDTGIGISPKHIEKIWEVFYRIDPSPTTQGEGIGLCLAKRIVEKHRGKIYAESEYGAGTTFYIELLKNNFKE
jgi:PAS domain S-box-containing protein